MNQKKLWICVKQECNSEQLIIDESNTDDHWGHDRITAQMFFQKFEQQVSDEVWMYLQGEKDKLLQDKQIDKDYQNFQLKIFDQMWDQKLKDVILDCEEGSKQSICIRERQIRQFWLEGKSYSKEKYINLIGDLQKGYGTFKDVEEAYVQDFILHKSEERCEYIWSSGKKFIRWFTDGQLQVRGEKILPDGRRYVEGFKDGQYNGKGEFIWPKGDRYVGDWVDGNYDGKGEYIWADGRRYVGDFVDSKKQGKGEMIWVDGHRYVGDWLDDQRNGQGEFIWADGHRYVGDWVDDKKNGKGEFISADGRRQEGEWVDDKFMGHDNCILY